jgi:hypothetical protein
VLPGTTADQTAPSKEDLQNRLSAIVAAQGKALLAGDKDGPSASPSNPARRHQITFLAMRSQPTFRGLKPCTSR